MLTFFVGGIFCGRWLLGLHSNPLKFDLSLYLLYLMLFLVGIGIGSDSKTWHIIRRANIKVVLIPLAVICGTFMGVGLIVLWLPDFKLRESLAVGAGFGYYSLSSVLIKQIHSETLGVVALLANIIREILTLLLTPILTRHLGKLAPIASGGATTMDTTLPIITRFAGKEYAMLAVFNGMVLTILVPFLVTLILT